ncbi:hypothetical protein EYV96_17020 [Dyella terrae]|uniref:Uncharacterized protein n=3 Tax=Rhodanobacteraceae TaxID=1775411 RepID=A0A4V2NKZ2_9GAMM|nr:hypothetical protein EYV96_17020 [Dyella terrae]TCI06020.1 hypothetical protein EZM97_36110 [Dyella soli]
MSSQLSNTITDAVTQTNTRPERDAPTIALASLYQATAHGLGVAVENAVSVQQQNYILMQAATTQAVMLLLSTNGADRPPTEVPAPTHGAQQAKAIAASLEAVTNAQLEAFASKAGHENVGPWCQTARELMSTAAQGLRELQEASREADFAMVKQAAIASVLIHMINAPDQLEAYQKMLKVIAEL